MDQPNNITSDMIDWFLAGQYDLRETKEIGIKLKEMRVLHLKDHGQITKEMLSRSLSDVRKWLELKHRTTLINVPSVGYKVSTKKELAIFSAKQVKRTLMHVDRTYRVVEITPRKLLPSALKEVFEKQGKTIKLVSQGGRKYMQTMIELKQNKKLEVSYDD